MPKKKERNAEEWLKGRIRELEKENKALHRRVKELTKREHFYEGQDEADAPGDSEDTEPKLLIHSRLCSECGKGKITQFEIIGRIYEQCDLCSYRKKIQ